MAAISPVVGQPATQNLEPMVKEGMKFESKLYGGIGAVSGLIGGGIFGAGIGGAAGRPGAGAALGAVVGTLVGAVAGAGAGAVTGAMDGALATVGTGLLDPKTDQQFKTAAGLGAAVGGLVIGTATAIVTKRKDATVGGLVAGAVANYFVGRHIAEKTIERG